MVRVRKILKGFSNVLKVVRGIASTKLQLDTVKILETNVDDVSGEVLGNTIEKIMAHGAKDVTISSAITKKGRPTNLVSVICDSDTMNSIMELLVTETGTLGVRVRTSERYIVPRSVKTISVHIKGQSFDVRYKTRDLNNSSHFKIESDDIKEISGILSISFKDTEELLNQEVRRKDMTAQQLTKLLNWFEDKCSVLVALSGGVDSALVAYSAYVKLGKSAIAVTADYKTLAQEELEYAKKYL